MPCSFRLLPHPRASATCRNVGNSRSPRSRPCGSMAPFRSGTSQDRHAPAGRADTSDNAWVAQARIRSHKPVRSHAPSRGPAGPADSSRDDTTVRAVQGQTCPAGPNPSSGTTAIITGGSSAGGSERPFLYSQLQSTQEDAIDLPATRRPTWRRRCPRDRRPLVVAGEVLEPQRRQVPGANHPTLVVSRTQVDPFAQRSDASPTSPPSANWRTSPPICSPRPHSTAVSNPGSVISSSRLPIGASTRSASTSSIGTARRDSAARPSAHSAPPGWSRCG